MTTRIEHEIATSSSGRFARSAAAARREGLRFAHVASTGSTNDDLAEQARAGDTATAVLVADHQTAGRGRRDRRWVDTAGRDLLVSFRLPARSDADDGGPGPDAAGPHAVVAALAAALRQAAAEILAEPVGFKWPNDLVVETGASPGKLAGILAEYVHGEPGAVIVGCGMNIDSEASAPTPEAQATSLAAVGLRGAAAADPAGVADLVLAAAIAGLAQRLREPRAAQAELRAHSATLGRQVRVELSEDRVLVGGAVDIDAAGRLVVESDGQRTVVGAGDVVHLRNDGPGSGIER